MRILLTLLFKVIVILVLHSQIHIGLMGGGSLYNDVEVRGAVPLTIQKNEFLSLQTELAFAVRGNRALIEKLNIRPSLSSEHLYYLELPVLLKVTLPLRSFQPFLLIGPQIGYGLGARLQYIEEDEYHRVNYSFKELGLRSLDLGMTFGFGMEKSIAGGRKIFADYRYYLGVLDIDTHQQGELFNAGSAISIGFSLPIKLKETSNNQ